MNSVNLTGRLTRDPELKYSQSGTAIAGFSLAVPRQYHRDTTDFIDCVAFGKTAEIVAQHLNKGSQIGVTGSLQIESYTKKDGSKAKAAKVKVDSFEFLSAKGADRPAEREKSEWDSLGEVINLDAPTPESGPVDSEMDLPF